MTKKRMTKRKPVSSLSPYLTVRGAASAIDFYCRAFGAKEIARVEVADTDLVRHAELKICRTRVFLCDEHVATGILSPQSLGGSATLLHLEVGNAKKVWDAAIEAGAVEISPLQEVSWGGVCGKVVDPFGHYWSIASEVTDLKGQVFEKVADIELGLEAVSDPATGEAAEH